MQIKNYYIKHLLKVKVLSLKTFTESLEKNKSIDFEKCKARYVNDLNIMLKYLKDVELYTYSYTYSTQSTLYELLQTIKEKDTLEDLLRTIKINKHVLDLDVDEICYSTSTKWCLERYYEENNTLDNEVLENIADCIKADNNIKIFDPQCKNGNDVRQFAEFMRNSVPEIYGLDEEQYGIYSAKKIINRTIIGTLHGSKISNEVFDILFLRPRPQVELEHYFNGSIKESNEKHMLKQSYKFLKPGGLMVYTIPYNRMMPDMWYFVCKNFIDISVIRHERCPDKLITIYGIKSTNNNYAERLNELSNTNFDDFSKYCRKEYVVKFDPTLEVQLFRGSVIDIYELTDIIENDGLYNEFYKSFDINEKKKDTSPLLPFNLGQIGLILTSGELDGIVEEVPGVNHVIKGMTVKTVDTEEVTDSQSNTVTCKNTISNMVQLSAFTADGDFVNIS